MQPPDDIPRVCAEFGPNCPYVSGSAHNFTCTAVVCTSGRPRELERCIRSLQRTNYTGLRLLVVENGRRAGAEHVAEQHGADYLFVPRPGLSRARNEGARRAMTDLVAFIDDDAVADSGWLAAACKEFCSAQVAVVTGPILPLDDAADSPQFSTLDLGSERRVFARSTPQWFAKANFGGIGHGSNMVFRRDLFVDSPLFDVRLGRGGPLDGADESFAFFQLLDRGWQIVYTPDAIVRHFQHKEAQRSKRDLARSVAYFMFLFSEARDYRRELVQYILEALAGKRRGWRAGAATQSRKVDYFSLIGALGSAFRMYRATRSAASEAGVARP